MSDALLSTRHISHCFGSFAALTDISMDFNAGEVHAILGENGAGKSTLLNILSGIHIPTSGELQIMGHPVCFRSSTDAARAGIGMVHQHFMLVPTMTAIDNLILADTESNRAWYAYPKTIISEQIRKQADAFGWSVHLDTRIDKMNVGAQQRLEILKALQGNRSVILLDEPTAVLAPSELPAFFDTIRSIAATGKAIVFISHKLDEVMALSDRISILRRGHLVHQCLTSDTDTATLAKHMVGDDSEAFTLLSQAQGDEISQVGNILLEVNGMATSLMDSSVSDISFNVSQGEILGIAGIDGNGQTALAAALTGNAPLKAGSIRLSGTSIGIRKSQNRQRDFLMAGVAHIPADRHRNGLALNMSVEENLVLDRLSDPQYNLFVVLNRKAISAFAALQLERFDVRPRTPGTNVEALSGGNQQKVVIARALSRNPKLIVAVNPTRGLDVGAIAFVHRALIDATKQGTAVILISTELDEVISMSHRVGILSDGKLVDIVSPATPKHTIGHLMAGGKPTS